MATHATVRLSELHCITCGVLFCIPKDFDQRRRKDHQSFYCPAGHSQSYTEKTAIEQERDQLRRKVASLEETRRYLNERWEEEIEVRLAAERRIRGQKSVVTRFKKRIAGRRCRCGGARRASARAAT